MSIEALTERVYELKQREAEIKAERMRAEEALAYELGMPQEWEGTKTNSVGGFKVTLKRSMNYRIDAARLEQLAGSSEAIADAVKLAFRYKPEIDKKGWKALPDEMRGALSPAITMTPGKPSFTIMTINNEED